MSYELAADLDEELGNIEGDDEVRCVVLTGAGPRAFSSGGDIHQMVKSTPEEMAARTDKRREMNWHLATFTKPIVGAINGIAYGAGAQLTTMLDIRIGCENTEIQFLAAKYGRANSTWSLPLVVGMAKAKELLFTGRPIRAEEAERIGLLNQVVPARSCSTAPSPWPNRSAKTIRAWSKASRSYLTTVSAPPGASASTPSRTPERTSSRPTRRAKASKHFSSARESAKCHGSFHRSVIPAQAGIQVLYPANRGRRWIPACAGMTE